MTRAVVAGRPVVTGRKIVMGRGTTTPSVPVVAPPVEDPITPDPPILPPLPNAPVVGTPVESSLTHDGCTITTTIDQGCQGYIEYGTALGGPYGSETNHENSYTYSTHVQRISGLTASTAYYYKFVATNAAAQVGRSAEGTFITGASPDPILPPLEALTYIAKPVFSRPGLLVVVNDPTHTEVELTRVNTVVGQRHAYSVRPPWSCNEDWLLLDYLSGQRALLNGQTLAVVKAANTTGGYGVWSKTIPDLFYSGTTSGTWGLRRNTASAAGLTIASTTIIAALTGTISVARLGGSPPSNDDRYIARCGKKTNGQHFVDVIDTTNNTVTAQKEFGVNSGAEGTVIDSCGMSQSGTYIIVNFEVTGTGATQGTRVWPRALTGSGIQLSTANSHWDVGMMLDGTTDVMVQCSTFSAGVGYGLGMHRLSDGLFTPLITSWPDGHVSCQNFKLPGYALVSSFAITGTHAGRGEVFLIQLLASPQVRRFIHAHAPGVQTYAREPHAAASPSGTRGILASDWDATDVYSIVFGLDVVRT